MTEQEFTDKLDALIAEVKDMEPSHVFQIFKRIIRKHHTNLSRKKWQEQLRLPLSPEGEKTRLLMRKDVEQVWKWLNYLKNLILEQGDYAMEPNELLDELVGMISSIR